VDGRNGRLGGARDAEGRRRSRRGGRSTWVAGPLVVGAVTLTAACGSSQASGPGATEPSTQPSATGALLSSASTRIGTVLVDGRGRTVYEFANDRASTSTCTGACASDWPPVVAPTSLPSSLPGVSGQLGTTTRDDGSRQLTVAGHPVYAFAGDTAPGQTNGQGIRLNGGLWTAVTPSGGAVESRAPAAPNPPTTY
jgi:predicted lipoprotein with Yx(FWY)xxD motif